MKKEAKNGFIPTVILLNLVIMGIRSKNRINKAIFCLLSFLSPIIQWFAIIGVEINEWLLELFPGWLPAISWVKKQFQNKEVRIFTLVFLTNLSIKLGVDYLITPIIMHKYGFIYSWLITTGIYLIIGLFSMWLYDYCKIDCIKLEALKKAQTYKKDFPSQNSFIKFILKRNATNIILVNFIFASKNPGLIPLYSRVGYFLFNGFPKKFDIWIMFIFFPFIISILWNGIIYIFVVWSRPFWESIFAILPFIV